MLPNAFSVYTVLVSKSEEHSCSSCFCLFCLVMHRMCQHSIGTCMERTPHPLCALSCPFWWCLRSITTTLCTSNNLTYLQCLRLISCLLHTDGTQLVAGVGNRVLIFDAADGDLLHALKGHKVWTDYMQLQYTSSHAVVAALCKVLETAGSCMPTSNGPALTQLMTTVKQL